MEKYKKLLLNYINNEVLDYSPSHVELTNEHIEEIDYLLTLIYNQGYKNALDDIKGGMKNVR